MIDELLGWAFVLTVLALLFLFLEHGFDQLEARRRGERPATLLDCLRRVLPRR